jgi:hypothetical protein
MSVRDACHELEERDENSPHICISTYGRSNMDSGMYGLVHMIHGMQMSGTYGMEDPGTST